MVHYETAIYKGMLSIGYNPTFNGKEQTIEVNILDFDKDIYGVNLTLEFVEYIRAEKKFESIQALTDAIAGDEKIIRQILG